MGMLGKITRRVFLFGSVAVAGGAAFGFYKYKQPYDNPLLNQLKDGETSLNAYLRVDQSGVTVFVPRAEMGQGVSTTLAALVAEELHIDLAAVNVEHGPASHAYFNGAILEEGLPFAPTNKTWLAETARDFAHVPAKFLGWQVTGGSSSVTDAYQKMREAGAGARAALLQAAADRTGIDVSQLTAENGAIVSRDGKGIPYEDLAQDAAKVSVDVPQLASQISWKILGVSQHRKDALPKSTGTAQFSIDVRPKDVLYATVRMNPHLGAPMKSFDATKAEKMRGVKRVVELDNGFAVIATNTWYALQAAKAVKVVWIRGDYPQTSDDMMASVKAAFNPDAKDNQNRNDGDVDQALASAKNVIEAEYQVPYLAHATMEPMNATAFLQGGRLDVWAGTQIPTQVRAEGEAITGLSQENVFVHTTYMGGGFGRRAEMDFIRHAIKLANEMPSQPVKVTWSREEDMTHDTYRPMAAARFKAALEKDKIVATHLEIAAESVMSSKIDRIGISVPGPDGTITQAAWDQPYRIPNYRVTGYRAAAMLPVGFWRSVGASQNGFFHESMIDELAHAAGVDPLEFRLGMMDHEPSVKVLKSVANLSGWRSPVPEGHGRGLAFVMSFGVPTAQVIEVAKHKGGIRIVKAFAAVDVGIALDPDIIKAQVSSGLYFGLTAAMMGEISVKDGVVQQNNFHSYDGIRINQAPPVDVSILENGEKIRGIGEPGTPPAAPALANAIFAATGKRIRELPLRKHIKFV